MVRCDGNHPGREARAGAYTPDQCRLCWLYENEPAYRALWDAEPGTARTVACRERGAVLREEVCPSCRGQVRLKVFACSVHAECTVGKAAAGLACCATCPDYDPGPSAESAPEQVAG